MSPPRHASISEPRCVTRITRASVIDGACAVASDYDDDDDDDDYRTRAPAQGIYLLSTLVQLRTSFPPAMDGADAGILSALPAYKTFGSVFDWSFLVSAGLGLVV